ncbi:MAG: flagellar biosynthetic protein FliO [Chromatiales bacterium]
MNHIMRKRVPGAFLAPAVIGALAGVSPGSLAAAASTPGVSVAQVGQIIAGLLVVLAVFAAAVFLLKRLPMMRAARNGHLKVMESMALGTRDRLLLIDVEGARLLLGITPGHIACLHVLSPTEGVAAAQPGFAKELQQVMGAESARAIPPGSKTSRMDA